MLPLKIILYLVLLFFGMAGSVFYHPFIGIIGYLFTYNINPVGHWWGVPLVDWGIRYSLFLVVGTGIGIIIYRSKLKFKSLFVSQEILLILFLGIIWLSIPFGLGFNSEDTNAIKMTKVVIIILMASHIITDFKKYEIMLWTLIIAGLYLGYETYQAPDWMFEGGRIDRGIGGSDFNEGNFLGSHFGILLPFIGVMFLKGGWKNKVICLISGVFVINGVILCRSRGVFLAILLGIITAIIFSIRGMRKRILLGIIIAMLGSVFLIDPGFWSRMESIEIDTSEMGPSAQGRILAWEAALSITWDYPLGIGEGNFKKYVGQYNPNIPGKDTHDTFLRCLAELGVQGLFIYMLLIANAFNILRKLRTQVRRMANETDFRWHIYGLTVSIIIFISSGMFITHTYIEELYWLLLFPVFLKRSVENQLSTQQPVSSKRQQATSI